MSGDSEYLGGPNAFRAAFATPSSRADPPPEVEPRDGLAP